MSEKGDVFGFCGGFVGVVRRVGVEEWRAFSLLLFPLPALAGAVATTAAVVGVVAVGVVTGVRVGVVGGVTFASVLLEKNALRLLRGEATLVVTLGEGEEEERKSRKLLTLLLPPLCPLLLLRL